MILNLHLIYLENINTNDHMEILKDVSDLYLLYIFFKQMYIF